MFIEYLCFCDKYMAKVAVVTIGYGELKERSFFSSAFWDYRLRHCDHT